MSPYVLTSAEKGAEMALEGRLAAFRQNFVVMFSGERGLFYAPAAPATDRTDPLDSPGPERARRAEGGALGIPALNAVNSAQNLSNQSFQVVLGF